MEEWPTHSRGANALPKERKRKKRVLACEWKCEGVFITITCWSAGTRREYAMNVLWLSVIL